MVIIILRLQVTLLPFSTRQQPIWLEAKHLHAHENNLNNSFIVSSEQFKLTTH